MVLNTSHSSPTTGVGVHWIPRAENTEGVTGDALLECHQYSGDPTSALGLACISWTRAVLLVSPVPIWSSRFLSKLSTFSSPPRRYELLLWARNCLPSQPIFETRSAPAGCIAAPSTSGPIESTQVIPIMVSATKKVWTDRTPFSIVRVPGTYPARRDELQQLHASAPRGITRSTGLRHHLHTDYNDISLAGWRKSWFDLVQKGLKVSIENPTIIKYVRFMSSAHFQVLHCSRANPAQVQASELQ